MGVGGAAPPWADTQSWGDDARFEEVDDSEDDYRRYAAHPGNAQQRFYSDKLYFDGIDPSQQRYRDTQRSREPYYDDDPPPSDEDYYYYYRNQPPPDDPTRDRSQSDSSLILKEQELVDRALERIARARALGKTNVKLSQAEIDALERLERANEPPKPAKSPSPPKALPAPAKKQPKTKAVEVAKKSKDKRSNSPKSKPVEGRVRNRSNASTRSARDDEPLESPPLNESGYVGSPLRPGSRTTSSQSLRGGMPPVAFAPYYSNRYQPTEAAYARRDPYQVRALRPDPIDPDWEPRSRSNSDLKSYPLDRLPNPTATARAPRFDPSDPRYGSPSRRVVSGPPAVRRMPEDELYLPDDAEVMSYRVDDDDDDSSNDGGGVTVDILDEPGTSGGYTIRTTRGAAAASTSKKAGVASSSKPAKATVRRR